MEEQVGITEYLTQGEGIGGELKLLTSDFVVQEITDEGEVVELKETFQDPEEFKEPSQVYLQEGAQEGLTAQLGEEVASEVVSLVERINAGEDQASTDLECPSDKQERRNIHLAVKNFAVGISSSTDLTTNKITLFSSQTTNKKRKVMGVDPRQANKPPGKHIHFVLWKENLETMIAVKQIAKYVGTKDKWFGVAGNKDKKAITTQKVSVFSNLYGKLKNLNLPSNIKIGNFSYSDKQIKLGDLKGNCFTIILRNIKDLPQESINSRLETLSSKGFINYFGLQRFGTSKDNPTHLIGLAIIKGDYQKAVDLIMGPRPCKHPSEAQARENWIQNKSVEEALKLFPRHCVRPN